MSLPEMVAGDLMTADALGRIGEVSVGREAAFRVFANEGGGNGARLSACGSRGE